MPKRPMTSGTSPTPSSNSGILKLNRAIPDILSRPMVPTTRPKAAIIKARIMEAEVRKVKIINPRTIKEKYSGGPNFRAKSTSGGEISIMPTTPIVPAIKEPKAEKRDREIWAEVNWGKLLLTVLVLFIYTALFSTIGFVIATIFLLFFLYRLMEPRPWWIVLIASGLTTGLFYLGFKIGLESQLPGGFLGF